MSRLGHLGAFFITGVSAFAVMALLSACTRTQGSVPAGAAPAPLEVHITHLTTGPITRAITLPAQVLPDQQATLYAKVSGYLQSISVDKGDRVNAGAVVARIEVPELLSSRAKQQAELRAAEAEYARLEESLKRAPDLVVPLLVDQSRGRMEVARASLEQSETMLRYATLTAPFAGIVTQRFVDPGALIQAGASNGAAIITLMDFRKVRLQVAVPELEASRVAAGQPVSVTSESLPGKTFEGKVARFTYALDLASRTMLAEVSLDNPDLVLRPGMLVTAKLGIERREQASVIPSDAISMEKTNAFVFVVDGENASKRPVKLGFSDGKNVEVLEGVNPNDALVLIGGRNLSNGQPLRVVAQ